MAYICGVGLALTWGGGRGISIWNFTVSYMNIVK